MRGRRLAWSMWPSRWARRSGWPCSSPSSARRRVTRQPEGRFLRADLHGPRPRSDLRVAEAALFGIAARLVMVALLVHPARCRPGRGDRRRGPGCGATSWLPSTAKARIGRTPARGLIGVRHLLPQGPRNAASAMLLGPTPRPPVVEAPAARGGAGPAGVDEQGHVDPAACKGRAPRPHRGRSSRSCPSLGRPEQVPLPYADVDDLAAPDVFHDLQSFLNVYFRRLLGASSPNRILRLLHHRLPTKAASQGVRHAEIFFDPQTHTDRGVLFGRHHRISPRPLGRGGAEGSRRACDPCASSAT